MSETATERVLLPPDKAAERIVGASEMSTAPPLDVCKDCAPKVKAWLDWLEKQLAEAREAKK